MNVFNILYKIFYILMIKRTLVYLLQSLLKRVQYLIFFKTIIKVQFCLI